MSEWYSYNHTASANAFTSVQITGSFQPGDGGGEITVAWSVNGPIGTGYVMIEGVVTAGDPITSTGSTGEQGPYTSSPSTISATLGSNAEGYVIARLYDSGNSLLDTEQTIDGILPL